MQETRWEALASVACVREGVGKGVMTETPAGLRDGMHEKSSGDALVVALELDVGSRIMAPKGIHMLIPKPVNTLSSMAKVT